MDLLAFLTEFKMQLLYSQLAHVQRRSDRLLFWLAMSMMLNVLLGCGLAIAYSTK